MRLFLCALCFAVSIKTLGEPSSYQMTATSKDYHIKPIVDDETKSPLEYLKRHQCRSIPSINVAENILNQQASFAEKTFKAFNYLNNSNGVESKKNQRFIEVFNEYYRKIILESAPDTQQFFDHEQRKMYQFIHEVSGLSDPEKMAMEYGVGLIRVLKAYELTLAFVEYLLFKETFIGFKQFNISEITQNIAKEDTFFSRIAIASKALIPIIDEIARVFMDSDDSKPTYWQAVSNFYAENPDHEQLAKSLVSIQYVPDEVALLGIAQFVHWNGLGGNGTYPTQDELESLKAHSFDYHGKKCGNEDAYQYFNQRMRIFGNPKTDLQKYIDIVLFNALYDQDNGKPIYIYDACSGPKYSAVSGITKRLEEKGTEVLLTLSDVDGKNLKTLLEEKNSDPNTHIEDVYYEDLNLPLKTSKDKQNHYDLVSASYGLHQLPEENQKKAIQYFTKLARVGGFISIPHINELVYSQPMLIPVNIADRESYVSDELLLSKFTQLAVPTTKKSLVKVPYPISKANIPKLGSSHKSYHYGYTLYLVVELSESELESLQGHFNRGEYRESNKIIQQFTGFDIEQWEEKLIPSDCKNKQRVQAI